MTTRLAVRNDAGVVVETTLEDVTRGMDPHLAHATRTAITLWQGYLPAPHRPVHARPAMPSIDEALRFYLEATR